MKNATTSYEVLTEPALGTHFVQLYQDSHTLVDAVCQFTSNHLSATEAVIIITTPAHRPAIQTKLVQQGITLEDAEQQGQFNFLDVESTLASFTDAGELDFDKAEANFRNMLESLLKNFSAIRIYGEIVDLLWQRGDKQHAKTLELLWNKLLREYPLSVLCTYCVDNLDPAVYPNDIECLCSTHTHFLPSQDFDKLDSALAKATENVMGVSLSGMMSSIGKFRHTTTNMPAAQASLLYISKTMPITTEFILRQLKKQLSGSQNPA